jgi:ribosomal-protein-alanine N-acetyltransferase
MVEHNAMMGLSFLPMDEASARAILSWRYAQPYDIYNADSSRIADDLPVFLKLDNGYYSVWNSGELVAYRCFGPEARVPGGAYVNDAVDTGGGMRPDLTGQGRGLGLLIAGLTHGGSLFGQVNFRVTCAEFNRRAQTVCERAGFRHVERFERPSDGMPFVVMLQDFRERG